MHNSFSFMMRNFHNIGKFLALCIPQIRRLYELSLTLKVENSQIVEKLTQQESQIDGVDAFGDPVHVLSSNLPSDMEGQCEELERRILLILGSKRLKSLPVEKQIIWIQQIFSQCISRLHPSSRIFAELIDDLIPSIFKSKSLSITDACVLYDSMYGLYWCSAQSLMDMRGFDKQTVALFREYLLINSYASHVTPIKAVNAVGDMNIGYFCHYAYESQGNALAPVVKALAKSHARNSKRNIYIYCVQWSSNEFMDDFKSSNVTVRNFPNQAHYSELESLAKAISEDNIDVLITEVASSISSYIFSKRVAPIQIWLEPGYPFWTNPDVDWVLVPGKQWQPWFGIPFQKHSELRLGLPLASGNKNPSEIELLQAKSKLPKGVKIFSVFTRLIKITPNYLNAIKSILDQAPNAHMLIVGSGDPRLVKSLMHDQMSSGRLTLLNENVDLNIYGRIIDVFLDTFPFIGGLACRDVACHGKPVVAMLAGEWDLLLREERVPSLLVDNIASYVGVAVRLVNDDAFYEKCAAESKLVIYKTISEVDMISGVEFAINSAIYN